jgi:hypothetical protein
MRIGIIHFLAPLQPRHRALDARVDGARGRHHTDETADHQHEQGDVNGIGGVAARIVEAGDRGQNDVKKTLRIGVGGRVRSRYGNVLAKRLGRRAFILAGRDHPCKARDDHDQREEDGIGRGEVEVPSLIRRRGCSVCHRDRPSPTHAATAKADAGIATRLDEEGRRRTD